jgi:hypothetical protein
MSDREAQEQALDGLLSHFQIIPVALTVAPGDLTGEPVITEVRLRWTDLETLLDWAVMARTAT